MNQREALYLPYPGLLVSTALKTALLWLLLRLMFLVIFWLLAQPEAGLHQPGLGIPAVLVWLDRRFYHEQLLPANLGASEVWFWGTALVVALGLDVGAGLLLALR